MQNMGLNKIRETFLSFFESKGHLRLPSAPLVPENDKSILLINAGMTPLKPYFTGEQTPPSKRAVSCQKCIRTIDIENVGKTSRHATFFEMLGNFSFGDYFKKEAIAWAWEFCIDVLKLPEEKLYVTVYLEDDEAHEIWEKDVKVNPSHISRLGKKDNFWEHGEGPCGPCSEIYFDRGLENGCGDPDCKPGCECDRFVEFWNLVFTQFDNDGKGNYTKLDTCNIDTGMGLERLACVMQGVDSIFDVDTLKNIMAELSKISSAKYGDSAQTDISLRIVTDHIRSTVFMVSDGILPSNEGRGYVLRRLLRRAARHGKLLGIKKDHFLIELAEVVIRESGEAYPELIEKKDYIKTIIEQEENRFNQTIDSGLVILSELMDKAIAEGKKEIEGKEAFRLYDTFGFPLDLTLEILEEKGMSTNQKDFDACMEEQKTRARQARSLNDTSAWKGNEELSGLPETIFVGYSETQAETEILKILNEEDNQISIILAKTPFYAESGGQIGDCGKIVKDGAEIKISTCKKVNGVYLHKGEIINGEFSEGDKVKAKICTTFRNAVMRSHSAAHLLQHALKTVLGTHVAQAGSYVDNERTRFDFSHFAAMTPEEIKKVEDMVNENILAGLDVKVMEMTLDEAKETGAIALFGEKYGDIVRVVKMGDVSTEFCGGTHVSNTGKIGLFKIISETGISAGVRRIEAITGLNLLHLIEEKDKTLAVVANNLKTNPSDVAQKAESTVAELKNAIKEIEELNQKISLSKLDDIEKTAEEINGKIFISGAMSAKTDILRNICDQLKDKYQNGVILLIGDVDGKVNIACGCGKEAIKLGANAGNFAKTAAQTCLGGGGGRPDSATAGGKDASKIPEAIKAVKEML